MRALITQNNSEERISQHLVKLKRRASSRIKEKHTKRRKKQKSKKQKQPKKN